MKQYKYFLIKSIKSFLNFDSSSIYLFVHKNNTDIFQDKLAEEYNKNNNIKHIIVNKNFIRKLSKNNSLFSLCAGPTQILKFDDIKTFYKFSKESHTQKNFIPLSIYWNENFIVYNFFLSFINKNKAVLLKETIFPNLLQFLQNPLYKIITLLNFKNLFYILKKLIK